MPDPDAPDALELQAHAISTAMEEKYRVIVEDYWRRDGRAFLKYSPPGGPMWAVTLTLRRREASPDPVSAELDAIAGRIDSGTWPRRVAALDAPRLLAAVRFLLDALPYATAEEQAALTAVLTGQEATPGG